MMLLYHLDYMIRIYSLITFSQNFDLFLKTYLNFINLKAIFICSNYQFCCLTILCCYFVHFLLIFLLHTQFLLIYSLLYFDFEYLRSFSSCFLPVDVAHIFKPNLLLKFEAILIFSEYLINSFSVTCKDSLQYFSSNFHSYFLIWFYY